MTPATADATEPIAPEPSDPEPSDPGYPTFVMITPIFVGGGARRRRLIVRGRYLMGAACLAYLTMLGVSFTASPVRQLQPAARPAPTVDAANPSRRSAQMRAKAAPRAAQRVEIPVTRAFIDGDAAQDAPLLLRLPPPTPRSAPAKLPTTTPPIPARPTGVPRRDHDNDTPERAKR